MTKPTNKHPWRIGNEHGEMRFGHIIKNNQFGIYLRTGDDSGRHYIRFKTTGDVRQGQKGSTNMRAPGSFTFNCGEDIQGAKSADGGKVVSPPAFAIQAQHGDVNIAAPKGTIRLMAQNIELIASGADGKNGVIKLNSNEKIRLESPDIELNSSVSTKIVSENTVNLIGSGIMNVYGGLMDFADGATALLGSKNGNKESAKSGKLSSLLEDTMRDVETSLEATANELKKSKLPAKLKDIAESPEVAELTGQIEGMAGDMEGLKNEFEKQAEEMSKKFGGFFKDNL